MPAGRKTVGNEAGPSEGTEMPEADASTDLKRPDRPVAHRIRTVSGRENRWYRIPADRVLVQAPQRTHLVEARLERFSETLWIGTIARRFADGSRKEFADLEQAEAWWVRWLEARTEPRWPAPLHLRSDAGPRR